MLLQASISMANTERWALERGEQPPPPVLTGLLRNSAYEVTVVDQFHRLARREFEKGGYRAAWERPFPTGSQGRPLSVDVSLFHSLNTTETRIELGTYTKKKLKEDATKLRDLRATTLLGFETVLNLIALWEVKSERLTGAEATKSMRKYKDAAADLSIGTLAVSLLLASAVDLFSVSPDDHRHVVVGLFEVT